MDTINGFINLLLILVPVGATIRIALCLIYMSTKEDPSPYKKKAWHALVYAILAETVAGAMKAAVSYFGGGIVY